MPATRAWDESKPSGTDYIAEGDDEIRNTKVDIRERLALEHIWGANVTDDGLHKDGSARIQSGTDAAKPTSPKLNQLYYATDTYKLYHCKTAGSWTDITAEFVGFVRTTGDQTIAGIKTFSSIPVLPAANPTADNEASRKAYVDGKFPIGTDQIGTEVVTPPKLKHTFGETSLYVGTAGTVTNFLLAGGDYSFWPSLKTSGNRVDVYVAGFLTDTTYVKRIGGQWAEAGTLYAKCYYLTSSGQDHWLFLLIDKNSGDIIGGYSAPDHPAYGNGGDFNKIPHPFENYDANKHEIILVDNDTIVELKKQVTEEKSLLTLVNEEYKIGEETQYKPLHSGRFIGEEPELVQSIPDYIKVRKLQKKIDKKQKAD